MLELEERASRRSAARCSLFAPLKHARLDYMVQKAVEMGAGTLGRSSRASPRSPASISSACGPTSSRRPSNAASWRSRGESARESSPSVLDDWDASPPAVLLRRGGSVADPVEALSDIARRPVAVLIGPEGGFSTRQSATICLAGPMSTRAVARAAHPARRHRRGRGAGARPGHSSAIGDKALCRARRAATMVRRFSRDSRMARDTADTTPIETASELAALAGVRLQAARKMADRHGAREIRLLQGRPQRRCPMTARAASARCSKACSRCSAGSRSSTASNIIGLADPTGGGAISLEPGGQFELSGAPLKSLHQTCREVHAHLAQVREIGEPLGIGFLGLGMSPKWTRAETPVMPKSRYEIMARLHAEGRHARPRHDVPHLHGAGEPRFLQRSRHARQAARRRSRCSRSRPRCSPTRRSPTASRTASCRCAREIWRDTDNDRTGMLPFAFRDGFGFERYVDWALDVPMYFVMRDGRYHDVDELHLPPVHGRAAPNDLPERRADAWATGRTISRRCSPRCG